MHLTDVRSAQDVETTARHLYGAGFDSRRPGVLHVTAAWRRDDSTLVTMKIKGETPKSDHDFFVLNLCRARADAVVTTGKILREEPELCHDLAGPGQVGPSLADWRRSLGKSEPPISLILTSGRGLDFGHPIFHCRNPVLIYTTPEGRNRLAGAHGHGVEVVSDPQSDLRSAVSYLRRERQLRTITVEAGPSTSSQLYEPPGLVDELLLSTYEGVLSEDLQGGEFLSPKNIEERFEPAEPAFRVASVSGHWSFRRHLRSTGAPYR